MLEQFEQCWHIVVPSEYRDFLVQLGDAAPGQWGGLTPLGNAADPETGEARPLDEDFCARLREPFKGGHSYVDEEHADEAFESEDLDFTQRYDGVLPLAFGGCTMFAWLVVTVPERVQVWETDGGRWFPAATPLCRPVTFREWYAVWLHQESAGR